jgi:hypothetical protein
MVLGVQPALMSDSDATGTGGITLMPSRAAFAFFILAIRQDDDCLRRP